MADVQLIPAISDLQKNVHGAKSFSHRAKNVHPLALSTLGQSTDLESLLERCHDVLRSNEGNDVSARTSQALERICGSVSSCARVLNDFRSKLKGVDGLEGETEKLLRGTKLAFDQPALRRLNEELSARVKILSLDLDTLQPREEAQDPETNSIGIAHRNQLIPVPVLVSPESPVSGGNRPTGNVTMPRQVGPKPRLSEIEGCVPPISDGLRQLWDEEDVAATDLLEECERLESYCKLLLRDAIKVSNASSGDAPSAEHHRQDSQRSEYTVIDDDEALVDAIKGDNREGIEACLRAVDSDLERKVGFKGLTILVHAIEANNEAIVHKLLARGASVNNCTCRRGLTALHYATKGGLHSIALCLLNYGADVQAEDRKGETAMVKAVLTGDLKMVDILYNHKKETLSTRGGDGWSVLHYAVHRSSGQMIRMLLDLSPDLRNAVDQFGKTALHHCAEFQKKDSLITLINHRFAPDVNGLDLVSRNPLYFAASRPPTRISEDIVRILINKGAQVIQSKPPPRIRDYFIGRRGLALSDESMRDRALPVVLSKSTSYPRAVRETVQRHTGPSQASKHAKLSSSIMRPPVDERLLPAVPISRNIELVPKSDGPGLKIQPNALNADLHSFHLSYRRQIRDALALDSDLDEAQHREAETGLVRELSWVPTNIFCFCERENLKFLNYLKAYVEDFMDETWDWWPLQPRKHTIRGGCVRVTWQTPCANARSIDLPRQAANALRAALASAPAFLNNEKSIAAIKVASGTGLCGHANNSAAPSSASPPSPANGGPSSQNRQPATQQPQQNMPLTASGNVSSTNQTSANPSEPRHVYLCVKRGNNYHISDLEIHELRTDVKFFSALRQEYLKARKGIKYWFSIWRYDHCEFFQFSKFALRSVPVEVSFPHIDDTTYDFQPRPITPKPPLGPIAKEEFRDRFYTYCEDCNHSWHRQQMLTWLPSLLDEEAIKSLPKRRLALEMEDGKREFFWGLQVRERRSAAIVLAYLTVFNVPSVVFFFLWLFAWGHGSDLQNGSVPLLTSLSLTIGFVGWLVQSREESVR